jgi:hypothetical protein
MLIKFTQHKFAYGVLLLAIGAFLFYFYAVWPNRIAQRLASVIFVVFYFLWGIITHWRAHQLNKKIFTEYFAISLLVSLLLLLVTL